MKTTIALTADEISLLQEALAPRPWNDALEALNTRLTEAAVRLMIKLPSPPRHRVKRVLCPACMDHYTTRAICQHCERVKP